MERHRMKNGLLDYVLDIFYPRDCTCCFCGEESILDEKGLCSKCRSSLHSCPPLSQPLGIDSIRAAFLFDGPAREAVLRLKYSGRSYLAEGMALFMVPEGNVFDCVVPVPLHPSRLKKRRYNQSELLAEAIARRNGIPLRTDLLTRIQRTHTQQGLTAEQRRKNLKKAFHGNPAAAGLRILLVDDVVTTGSTLSACAAELKKNGAIEVHALCACGVPEWER